MKKRLYTRRIGGFIIVLICLFGILLLRFHNVYLGIFCLFVDLASFTIYAIMLRRHAGSGRSCP
jgi:hypothetical protein